jgi:ketosteroid isomerase-like protein
MDFLSYQAVDDIISAFPNRARPMATEYSTPQEAEDAFYDAIDDRSLDAMMGVWEHSDDIACLLPMQPLAQGRNQLLQTWKGLLEGDFSLEIQVHHIRWLELGDVAVHYCQEVARIAGQTQPQPPVHATNVYRKGGDGWHLILHQNSPAPPPPGMAPPGMQVPQ